MKHHKKIVAFLLTFSCVLMTGCGESLYRLTDDEARTIAMYSAKVVGKYNRNQGDGITVVKRLEESENQVDETSSTIDEGTEQIADGTVDNTIAMDSTAVPGNLQDVFSFTPASVTFKEFKITDGYKTDAVYLSAEKGKEYLVLTFEVENTTDSTIEFDALSHALSITGTVNSSISSKAETTILANDLSTAYDEIKANETKEYVLLFQYSKEDIEQMTHLDLSFKNADSSYIITLF